MRPKNSLISYLVVWFPFIFSACESHTLYHSYRTVPSSGWNRCDTLFFPIPLSDLDKTIRLSIEVRHSEDYPYTNLFLFINNDTVEFALADEDGKWNGVGLNAIYQNKFAYKDMKIEHPDTLQIQISHGMTDFLLPGIQNVGVCAETLTLHEQHQYEGK